MKKRIFVSCIMMFVLATAVLSGCTPTTPSTPVPPEIVTVFDATQFPAWVESDGVWRTVGNRSFLEGSQNAPTEEQLKTIMRLATLAPTSRGFNDYLLVVLDDVAQQRDVVGEANAHDGTITVLVFGDRLLPKEESLGGHDQTVDRGYYNVGIVTGYLNLAAISQGLGTRMYMTTEYTRAGSTRTMTTEEAYLKDKGYKYTLASDPLGRGDANRQVEAYGNLKFVAAVVIGHLNEQAETTVTDKIYDQNWVMGK